MGSSGNSEPVKVFSSGDPVLLAMAETTLSDAHLEFTLRDDTILVQPQDADQALALLEDLPEITPDDEAADSPWNA